MKNPIFINGKIYPEEKVRISPVNSSMLFGEGLFESIPVYRGQPLFLQDHLERLRKGCRFLDWALWPEAIFKKAIRLFTELNKTDENFMIRFNLYQDLKMPASPRSFSKGIPSLWASIRPLSHHPESFWPRFASIGISPWKVPDIQTVPNDFKWTFYMMTRQVYRNYPDWQEMIRVNQEGYAVDGASSSVLWFDGKIIRIPPGRWLGLQSVTQKKVVGLCRQMGIKVIEKPWRPRETFQKGEIILAGSGVGVMGVIFLNGRAFKQAPRLIVRLWQYYREWARNPNVFSGASLMEKPAEH
jgi:branched-subunit amino acid aminotransferase/4-amino-4-deoxychorismate lyase